MLSYSIDKLLNAEKNPYLTYKRELRAVDDALYDFQNVTWNVNFVLFEDNGCRSGISKETFRKGIRHK